MRTLLLALMLTNLALADNSLPYDLARVKQHACQVMSPYDRAVTAEEKKLCAEAAEQIVYALRFNYGIGERPEEDGCQLEDLEVLHSLYTQHYVRLSRTSHGELKAHLSCHPEGKKSYLYYLTYDEKTKTVADVTHAEP